MLTEEKLEELTDKVRASQKGLAEVFADLRDAGEIGDETAGAYAFDACRSCAVLTEILENMEGTDG